MQFAAQKGDRSAVPGRYEFVIRTPGDALRCAADAAATCGADWRVRSVLEELLMNAVEHGNLEIGFERKRALLLDGGLAAELERRLALPEYSGRTAKLALSIDNDAWTFEISDDGAGFDWRHQVASSADKTARSGRGTRLARMLGIAEPEYLERGNRVRLRFAPEPHAKQAG